MKNKRSSATGLGQFLDETWLDLIRVHRPDLARGRSQGETLELRRDAKVAREITTRFTEQNAEMLRKRGLFCNSGDAVFGALCRWRGRCGDLVSTGGCRRRLGYGQCRPYQAREDRQGQPVPRPPYGRRSKNLGGPQDARSGYIGRHATHPTSRKLTAPFSLSLGGRPRQNDDAKSSCQNPPRHWILARSVLRPAPNLLLRSRGAGVGLMRSRRAP